jgi:hypothetical protein
MRSIWPARVVLTKQIVDTLAGRDQLEFATWVLAETESPTRMSAKHEYRSDRVMKWPGGSSRNRVRMIAASGMTQPPPLRSHIP